MSRARDDAAGRSEHVVHHPIGNFGREDVGAAPRTTSTGHGSRDASTSLPERHPAARHPAPCAPCGDPPRGIHRELERPSARRRRPWRHAPQRFGRCGGWRASMRAYSSTLSNAGSRSTHVWRIRRLPRVDLGSDVDDHRPAIRADAAPRTPWRRVRPAKPTSTMRRCRARPSPIRRRRVHRSRSDRPIPVGLAVPAVIERERAVVRRDDGREVFPDVRRYRSRARAASARLRHSTRAGAARRRWRPSRGDLSVASSHITRGATLES
jgi:hypothetical protein